MLPKFHFDSFLFYFSWYYPDHEDGPWNYTLEDTHTHILNSISTFHECLTRSALYVFFVCWLFVWLMQPRIIFNCSHPVCSVRQIYSSFVLSGHSIWFFITFIICFLFHQLSGLCSLSDKRASDFPFEFCIFSTQKIYRISHHSDNCYAAIVFLYTPCMNRKTHTPHTHAQIHIYTQPNALFDFVFVSFFVCFQCNDVMPAIWMFKRVQVW